MPSKKPAPIPAPAPETPSFLDQEFFTKPQLAKELKKCERTIDRWAILRIGPPATLVGNTTYFRKTSVYAWLAGREQKRIEERQKRRRTIGGR
jgi:hypothetical protein